MKRKTKNIVFLLMAAVILTSINPATTEAAAKKTLAVSVKSTKITEKKTAQLTVKYDKKNVTSKSSYETSNSKIATVTKKGKVTAKKAGKATITVKYKGKSKKVKFTVQKAANQSTTVKKPASNSQSSSTGSKPLTPNGTASGGNTSNSNSGNSQNITTEATKPSTPVETEKHTHQYIQKTKVEKKWVPKMVEEDVYKTFFIYRSVCCCGDVIIDDDSDPEASEALWEEHDKKHLEMGLNSTSSSLEIIGEKKVKVGTKTVDRGHYEEVTHTYYECACGATK